MRRISDEHSGPMRVLYWNLNRRHGTAQAILRTDYDVIAVQEMPRDATRGTVYCPRMSNYYLVVEDDRGSRAALYVNKRYALGDWTSETGRDWCSMTFRGVGGQEPVTVISVYVEQQQHRGTAWSTPIHAFRSETRRGEIVLVGDFNLKHPLWDRLGRTEAGSDVLLDLAVRWQLRLVTPWGELTRQRQGQEDSTIDLAWASQGLRVTYEGDLGYTGSDHSAQVIRIERGIETAGGRGPEGWSWKGMDRRRVKKEAACLRLTTNLSTPELLDRAVDDLIQQLCELADEAVPRRKQGNGRSEPWWEAMVAEAVREAQHARRRWIAVRSEANWERHKEADREQQRAVHAARTKCWRRVIAEASKDNKKIWMFERWAWLQSHGPQEMVKLLNLGRTEGEPPTATTHREKTRLLAERFFLNPDADLSDIVDRSWSDESFQGPFTVGREVNAAEVTEILCKTGAWKVPGTTNWLPTGFLKACRTLLAEALARITNASFTLEYYPKRFKVVGVVVLAKPGKTIAQKQTLGGWCPIALLSVVGKIIETVVSRRVADTAEDHRLLPEGQMGNRRERSTELAIRAVTDAVYTAWAQNATTSLLQLDIKGAFDTVNHVRLLDTM